MIIMISKYICPQVIQMWTFFFGLNNYDRAPQTNVTFILLIVRYKKERGIHSLFLLLSYLLDMSCCNVIFKPYATKIWFFIQFVHSLLQENDKNRDSRKSSWTYKLKLNQIHIKYLHSQNQNHRVYDRSFCGFVFYIMI